MVYAGFEQTGTSSTPTALTSLHDNSVKAFPEAKKSDTTEKEPEFAVISG